jgi:hypothetical protein
LKSLVVNLQSNLKRQNSLLFVMDIVRYVGMPTSHNPDLIVDESYFKGEVRFKLIA